MGICKGQFDLKTLADGMTSRNYFFSIIFIAILSGWSCSGPAEQPINTVSGNANSRPAATTSQNAVSETGPANSASASPPGGFTTRSGKKLVDSPATSPAPLPFNKAGEDSEIAVTMNGYGAVLEIRVFRSHPQLARVEATWISAREKSLKILLRTGRVIDVTTDRIANLQNATTSQLLEIAGLQTPARKGDGTKATDAKRPAQ